MKELEPHGRAPGHGRTGTDPDTAWRERHEQRVARWRDRRKAPRGVLGWLKWTGYAIGEGAGWIFAWLLMS